MVTIGNKKYYTVEEAALFGGVSIRTLRRWISAGLMSEFLYPFRTGPNEVMYRLEPPGENDVKNRKGEWVAVKGGAGA